MGTLTRLLAPLAALVLVAASSTPTAAATGSGVTYTVRTLHFAVVVGPGGAEHCDIVGDVYTPSDVSRTHRVPAILTTNGALFTLDWDVHGLSLIG